MSDTTIRWTCTKHLIDLIRRRSEMDGVTVEPGWPGDKYLTAEMVWVLDLDGDVTIPVMTGGRKHRDDKFEIPLQVRVAGRVDLDATCTRVAELVAAIEDVLAVESTLEDFEGVISAEVTRERATAGRTPEGCLGFAEVVIAVHARLI